MRTRLRGTSGSDDESADGLGGVLSARSARGVLCSGRRRRRREKSSLCTFLMPGCGPSDAEERRPESDLPPSDSVVDGELCVVAGLAVDDMGELRLAAGAKDFG